MSSRDWLSLVVVFACAVVSLPVYSQGGGKTLSELCEGVEVGGQTEVPEKLTPETTVEELCAKVSDREQKASETKAKTDSLALFMFSGNPHSEELMRVELTARKDVDVKLYSKPHVGSKVVGKLSLEKGQKLSFGKSIVLRAFPIRPAPAAFTLRADKFLHGTQKPEGDIQVTKGELVAVGVSYQSEGMYSCQTSYGERYYQGCPPWFYGGIDVSGAKYGEGVPKFLIENPDGEKSQWWVVMSSGGQKGWMRADVEELKAERKMIEGYGP